MWTPFSRDVYSCFAYFQPVVHSTFVRSRSRQSLVCFSCFSTVVERSSHRKYIFVVCVFCLYDTRVNAALYSTTLPVIYFIIISFGRRRFSQIAQTYTHIINIVGVKITIPSTHTHPYTKHSTQTRCLYIVLLVVVVLSLCFRRHSSPRFLPLKKVTRVPPIINTKRNHIRVFCCVRTKLSLNSFWAL